MTENTRRSLRRERATREFASACERAFHAVGLDAVRLDETSVYIVIGTHAYYRPT